MKYFSSIIFRFVLTRQILLFLICLAVSAPIYILAEYIFLHQGSMSNQSNLDILMVSIYSAPSRILSMSPIIIGITTIIWLIQAELNKHFIKMEILGSQAKSVIFPMGVVFFAILSSFTLLFDDSISDIYAKSRSIINNGSENSIKTAFTEEGVWIRRFEGDKTSIIYAEKFDRAQQIATNISFYLINTDHKLVQRLSAENAILRDGYWIMRNGMEIAEDSPTVFFDERKLPTLLTLKEVISSMQPPRATSLRDIGELKRVLEKNGLPTSEYSSFFLYTISLPLFAVAMIFLISYFMLFSIRKYSLITGIIWGLSTLIVVSFAVRMPHAFSRTGDLDAFIGSSLPAIILLALGSVLIARQSE